MHYFVSEALRVIFAIGEGFFRRRMSIFDMDPMLGRITCYWDEAYDDGVRLSFVIRAME